MQEYYGYLKETPSPLELQNRALAREAAREGFVLLENHGALPITTKKVALYGMGARQTVKGGLGSGSVEERYSVSIEEGLKNAGFKITTGAWLDDYDAEYHRTYEEYRQMVENKIAGLTNPLQVIPLAHSYVYRYPSGRMVTAEDIAASDTNTAIYVLMRQAGEGNDRKLEQGDYYITDIERENIRTVAAGYNHTILVINVGGHMDLGFLDEISGIDAVILFVQGGEEGGNALADVLCGKHNFSGKLADTIPLRYEDIPFADTFSYLNGDTKNEFYREGIYLGYRYFDSFQKAVRYPFGFGLSYTSFAITTKSVEIQGTKVTVDATVTNTGSQYSGKEVVQLYLSAPAGEIVPEYQELIAFQKTDLLEPGQQQELKLHFDLRDAASYHEGCAAYVLQKGTYILRIGNSSRNTTVSALLELPETVLTQQCRSCCKLDEPLEELIPLPCENEVPEGALKLQVDPSAITPLVYEYSEPEVSETLQEKSILDGLTLEEMAEFLRGGELQRVPKEALEIHGAGGKTVTSLLHKGIRNVVFSDGPAGINIVNQVRCQPDGTFKYVKIPERYDWGMFAKIMKARVCSAEGTLVCRYATAWPVEMLLAQSWDTDLLERVGQAAGAEMLAFGITVWLAPGMNLHRNPLGGRAFEYYSEDPLLTGKLAAALIRGVQIHPGVGACAKHFCCNNAEDNRNGSSSNLSERALREIYLKGFEIAVRESQPKAMMSSYNLLNHVYTANRHDLLCDILRCEWGFKGLVMTDWGSCNPYAAKPELCAPAGNDLIMQGSDYDKEEILQALHDGRMSPADVRRSACRVLRLMLEAKTPVLIKPIEKETEE